MKMPVLEMMKKDVNSVVGLTVSYDFGGSKPLVGKVVSTKKNKIESIIDGELSVWYSYGISFGGCSYYTVDKFTKVLDNL
jgi:hypothetical protein